MPNRSYILALDVGARRIGVALASTPARIASPLLTLEHSPEIFTRLQELIERENVDTIVVGLPRGLDGQTTAQTSATETFIDELRGRIDVPIFTQDEALTSVKAEAELASRRKPHAKAAVDALAATYILEDFLREQPEVVHG